MDRKAKIYVAGHKGLVGSAIVRKLRENGYENLIGLSSAELDLRNQAAVNEFFARESQNTFSWQQQKWGEYGLTALGQPSLYMTT